MRPCHEILKSLKILYVEDEKEIRDLLQDVLQEEFVRFDTASNAKEGLDLFFTNSYDCVITDIEMPNMDGLTLAQKIKEYKDIPILLLTAYSEKERLFKAIDIGVSKYLIKPFTPEKLLEALCDIFLKRMRKEQNVILAGNIIYDRLKGEVSDGDQIKKLTKKEKKLLDLLLKRPNEIVTFEEIEKELWTEGEFSENALRTLVKRVRKKTDKSIIENFSGLGYKIKLKKL